MILREILNEFQKRIDDPNYWDDTKGTALANEAMREITGVLSLTFKGFYEFYTEASRKQYDVPFDFVANHLLYYNDDNVNKVIQIVNSPDQLVGKVSDLDEEGQPSKAWLWNYESRLTLNFYPVPDDVYSMQWWYFREEPKLENMNDEPILDRLFHQYIIDYMILTSKRDDKEINESEYVGLWEVKKRSMRSANTKIENLNRENRIPSGKQNFPNINDERITIVNVNSGGVIW